MGTKALISPEQYVATHYEWEPEYVRGQLKERPMPDRIHGHIRALLCHLFFSASKQIGPLLSVRCRLAHDVFRLPDVAVFSKAEPFVLMPVTPPLAVIQVVAEDEKHVDLIERLRDYEQWGVPRIWVVNPCMKALAEWRNGALLPMYGIEFRLEQLIEGLPL